MCNQVVSVPSVTLQTAVISTVKELANQGKSFSIHDITTAIRNKVAQGELEVPECEVSGAFFRTDIRHYKVKALFLEAVDNGMFDSDFRLDFMMDATGMYRIYTATPNVTAPIPVQASAPAVTPGVLPIPKVNFSKPSRNDVKTRVQLYLDHCFRKSFCPTLKRVQSAIKRSNFSTGYSCYDLKRCITTELGYKVIDDPDGISRAKVSLV